MKQVDRRTGPSREDQREAWSKVASRAKPRAKFAEVVEASAGHPRLLRGSISLGRTMNLKSLKDQIAKKAAVVAKKHQALLEKAEDLVAKSKEATRSIQEKFLDRCLRVDRRTKTLSICDEVLLPGLRQLAVLKAPEASVTIEPTESGFLVSALVRGKRVSSLLELKRVSYVAGEVEVEVATPEGATMEGRPVAQLFAALTSKLFGGTWLGLKLLSARLPSQLTWDGRKATLRTDLDAKGGVPPELMQLSATATVTRADAWTHFTFDTLGSLNLLFAYLLKKLLKLLFG